MLNGWVYVIALELLYIVTFHFLNFGTIFKYAIIWSSKCGAKLIVRQRRF